MRNPILLVQEAGIMIYARSSDLKIADLKRPTSRQLVTDTVQNTSARLGNPCSVYP